MKNPLCPAPFSVAEQVDLFNLFERLQWVLDYPSFSYCVNLNVITTECGHWCGIAECSGTRSLSPGAFSFPPTAGGAAVDAPGEDVPGCSTAYWPCLGSALLVKWVKCGEPPNQGAGWQVRSRTALYALRMSISKFKPLPVWHNKCLMLEKLLIHSSVVDRSEHLTWFYLRIQLK